MRIKQQAAVDYMISYGIAILVVAISIYIIVRLGVFGNALVQPNCVSAASFACLAFEFNANGLLTFTLIQTTGGIINITGVACSSNLNATGNGPQYGNLYVLSYSADPQFYPNNVLQYGSLIYSDNSTTLGVDCYGPGGVSTTNLGNPYTGYVWVNYTFTNLPPGYRNVERVMQFTAKAS